MSKQTLIELAKDTPLPTVAGLQFFGVPVSDGIVILTLAWAAWRLVDGVLNTYWKWKDRKKKEADERK